MKRGKFQVDSLWHIFILNHEDPPSDEPPE